MFSRRHLLIIQFVYLIGPGFLYGFAVHGVFDILPINHCYNYNKQVAVSFDGTHYYSIKNTAIFKIDTVTRDVIETIIPPLLNLSPQKPVIYNVMPDNHIPIKKVYPYLTLSERERSFTSIFNVNAEKARLKELHSVLSKHINLQHLAKGEDNATMKPILNSNVPSSIIPTKTDLITDDIQQFKVNQN